MRTLSLILLLLAVLPCTARAAQLHYYDDALLERSMLDCDPEAGLLYPALEALIRAADRALEQEPLTVTMKDVLPASGDPHDYLSYAPYYWPNPDTEDGLPWVNRDGERSPQSEAMPDRTNKSRLFSALRTLCLAWHFTGDERYAEHAALLVRTWFIDDATRMNPNLNHAQAIPGRRTGSGIGIIDWAQTPALLDQISMLEDWPGWTETDRREIRSWFGEFLHWLLTSENGKYEAGMLNNHGTYYDCIVVSLALFLGDEELAREVCSVAGEKRIGPQIAADGSQPLELRRTKSWDYSIYNLQAMVVLARLAAHVDVDLWHYTDDQGVGIREALLFLLPYAQGKQAWKWQQIKDIHYGAYISMLNEMAYVYADESLPHEIAQIEENYDPAAARLLFEW